MWMKGFFSKAGRLTLIRFVPSGIWCITSLFRAPTLVCNSIEKYTRDFLWEGVDEGHSFYLVSKVVECHVS